jgi:hypothetical protein
MKVGVRVQATNQNAASYSLVHYERKDVKDRRKIEPTLDPKKVKSSAHLGIRRGRKSTVATLFDSHQSSQTQTPNTHSLDQLSTLNTRAKTDDERIRHPPPPLVCVL